MKSFILSIVLMLTATFAMANPNQACTQGNAAFCELVGPAGPQGPQGVAGVDGQDGAQGVAGADGTNGINGTDGKDGQNGRDGRDFDSSSYQAGLASSTALGGLQYQHLSAGQTGWAVGIGGQFDGEGAFAIGINHAVTDNWSINGSIATSFNGKGTSAFVGASGRF